MKKYEVTFLGTHQELTVIIESGIEELDEVSSDMLIDLAMFHAMDEHGADFRERIDSYGIIIEPYEELSQTGE